MKTVLAAVAGFVLLISAVNVYAQTNYYTGNMLKERLTDQNEYRRLIGLGYIIGVVDTNTAVSICIPKGVTTAQLVAIVQKNLAEYPQNLHETASILVMDALSTAFPCRK